MVLGLQLGEEGCGHGGHERRGDTSAQVGEIAAAEGVVLHELSPQRGSLEEAFMRITGQAVEYRTESGGALATAGKSA